MPPKMMRKDTAGLEAAHAALSFKARADGTIEGYGAVFGNVDLGGDVLEAGAFSASLARGRSVKMLWQHDPHAVIGVWDEVQEDAKGLYVKGRILTDVQAGREAQALVKAGALDGLSIGYRTQKARSATIDERDVRLLQEVDLWEVSLVTFPMNPDATITAAKAAEMSMRDFERTLLRESKLSRQVVSALMRGGFKEVQALSRSGEDYSDLLEAVQAANLIPYL